MKTLTQHTPGPWKVIERNDKYLIQGSNGLFICSCGKLFTNKSDVHLIASAPELLASVVSLLKFVHSVRPSGGVLRGECEMIASAQAAVAKATEANDKNQMQND